MADTWVRRLRGWIGRRPVHGEGLWLVRCAWIHTAGMRGPIDAVFCRGDGTVLRVVAQMPPWHIAGAAGAAFTCEFPAGATVGVRRGDHLDIMPGPHPAPPPAARGV